MRRQTHDNAVSIRGRAKPWRVAQLNFSSLIIPPGRFLLFNSKLPSQF